jgi:hypothetical protein
LATGKATVKIDGEDVQVGSYQEYLAKYNEQ